MLGKRKCKILKEIRRRIAEENDIPYITSECNFQGECRGTCPKCEQELRDLEQQLERRQRLGKAVSVSALTASLLISTVGCRDPKPNDTTEETGESTSKSVVDVIGRFTAPTGEEEPEETEEVIESVGEVTYFEEPTEESTEEPFELAGDVAYVEESTDSYDGNE